MWWVVLTVLLAIGGAVCVFAMIGNEKGTEGRLWGGIGLVLAVGIFILITAIASVARIGTGEVGILKSFSGKLTGVHATPGWFIKAPWTSVIKESVQIQSENKDLTTANAAVSNDQQEITADLAINFEVDPAHVLDLYTRVGANWKEKLIDSRILQDFKEVTATYHTVDITNNREGLRKETLTRLKQELDPYSITVTDFFITNLGFSQAYQNAITAKQVQVQQAQQAEAKVAQAKAEAEQVIAKAKGDAEALRLTGAALRANPEVLKLKALEKLNPNAQVIFCANAACPSILGSLTSGK